MSFAVLIVRDGRDDIHERSIESLHAALPEPAYAITVDDADHKLGFAGAIEEGWRQIREAAPVEFVWHHEADFIYERPVPLEDMAAVLRAQPHLAQLALKRQPVNGDEQAAGGIVEMWPDCYRQRTYRGSVYTEHDICWTTNPALYPRAWVQQGWPQVPGSEVAWGERLKEDPDLRFAYWGAKYDPPLVEHIGEQRAGRGY